MSSSVLSDTAAHSPGGGTHSGGGKTGPLPAPPEPPLPLVPPEPLLVDAVEDAASVALATSRSSAPVHADTTRGSSSHDVFMREAKSKARTAIFPRRSVVPRQRAGGARARPVRQPCPIAIW